MICACSPSHFWIKPCHVFTFTFITIYWTDLSKKVKFKLRVKQTLSNFITLYCRGTDIVRGFKTVPTR